MSCSIAKKDLEPRCPCSIECSGDRHVCETVVIEVSGQDVGCKDVAEGDCGSSEVAAAVIQQEIDVV